MLDEVEPQHYSLAGFPLAPIVHLQQKQLLVAALLGNPGKTHL